MRLIDWMIIETQLLTGVIPFGLGIKGDWLPSFNPSRENDLAVYRPVLRKIPKNRDDASEEIGIVWLKSQPHIKRVYRDVPADPALYVEKQSIVELLVPIEHRQVHAAKPIREVQCKCGAALNFSCHGLSGYAHCSNGRRATQVGQSVEQCNSSVHVPVYRTLWGELFIEDHDSTALSAS